MKTDYLKDWKPQTDKKNGGFHLIHKVTGQAFSFMPNKEKGGFDIRYAGKHIAHHPHIKDAMTHAISYFKEKHDETPATVAFGSSPKLDKAEPKKGPSSSYFRSKLNQVKGVHKPYSSEGTSFAGDMARQAQATPGSNHAEMARKLHQQKLREILNIKPNLPKTELEKGKAIPGAQKGVHLPDPRTGKSKPHMALTTGFDFGAKEEHREKLAELKSMKKPSLPKAEMAKGEFTKEKTKDGYKLHHKNGHIHAHESNHYMDEIADGKSPKKKVTKYRVVPKGHEKKPEHTHDVYDSLPEAKNALVKKSELTKARIDEGKPTADKIIAREGRNTRYFRDRLSMAGKKGFPKHNQKGVHTGVDGSSPAGIALSTKDPEQKKLAFKDHAKVIADQKAMPKPNLPKSEKK